MFSTSSALTLDLYRLFLPLALPSVSSATSALKSAFQNSTHLDPAAHSPQASIPFRITSFAHPHQLTPIESSSCKKQVRGVPSATQPKPFPSFPQRVNMQRTATPITPFLSCVYFTVLWIPGGGGGTANPGCRHLGFPIFASRPRNTGHVFSARLCELRVSALSFSLLSLSTFKPFDLQTFQRRFSTTHYSLLMVLPQNFYPPASDLRHNPAAQGHTSVPLNQRAHSSSQTGRIQ
jgi:hypothetical protein